MNRILCPKAIFKRSTTISNTVLFFKDQKKLSYDEISAEDSKTEEYGL